MTDPDYTALDIEFILEAVADGPGGNTLSVAQVSRAKLRDDLGWAHINYVVASARTPKARKVKDRQLSQARKALRQLDAVRDMLNSPHDKKGLLWSALEAMRRATEKPRKGPTKQPARKTETAGGASRPERASPFTWLAGGLLPEIFQNHFHAKAATRRADGDTDTPFIRFAEGSLAVLGVKKTNGEPHERETIVRAVTDYRKRCRNMGKVA